MHRQRERKPTARQVVERTVFDAASGEWWRFDRYEIKDGVIQPAPGACLERYDLWSPFRDTKKFKDVASPYQALLQLVERFQFTTPGRLSRLTDVSQAAVLGWCQQNGPLGILLARWESITLAPQPSGDIDFVGIRYLRAYGQAVEIIQSKGNDVGAWKPTVLLHGLNDVTIVEESPDKTWRQFFPTVSRRKANAYHYPMPYTDEFCRLYAEPVFDFVVAAQLFAGAISQLAQGTARNPDADGQALRTINRLRRPISAIIDRNGRGDLQQIWQTPSLLASFAEMFAQDNACGRATRLCQCCQLPFVSSAYQAQYCSPKCRQLQQKRNVRKQAREARTLRAQGQTIRHIASALGQDRQIVKGWLTPPKR